MAPAFNGDLSAWDVAQVTSVLHMFKDASAFSRTLCGAAWVQSTADNRLLVVLCARRFQTTAPRLAAEGTRHT